MPSITISGTDVLYILGIACSLAVSLIGFLVKGILEDMKALKERQEDDERDLAEHKVHDEQTYAKENTMQQGMKELRDTITERFDIVQNDIKLILSRGNK
jgi:cytochrome c biogenesis protein ResB